MLRLLAFICVFVFLLHAGHAQTSLEVATGITSNQQSVPVLPRHLRNTFEAARLGAGLFAEAVVSYPTRGRFLPGAALRYDYSRVAGSDTWPSTSQHRLALGPRLTYRFTPIIFAVSGLEGTYSFRQNIEAGYRAHGSLGRTYTPWDVRGLLGLRGQLGRVSVTMTVERGFIDRRGAIQITDSSDQVYFPNYVDSAVRFGIGYVFEAKAVGK